ncbi:hypothetical protein CEXT_540421 [Caerostris extrusa]|uniref:Uncharacterized protein n=1 Tax=Caerostris extrusa TaxID=172846 RepID=A0AAV4VP31_CAEEX|nr:hypothetical protein CEXT_540421 [Caerostris extrusa]
MDKRQHEKIQEKIGSRSQQARDMAASSSDEPFLSPLEAKRLEEFHESGIRAFLTLRFAEHGAGEPSPSSSTEREITDEESRY